MNSCTWRFGGAGGGLEDPWISARFLVGGTDLILQRLARMWRGIWAATPELDCIGLNRELACLLHRPFGKVRNKTCSHLNMDVIANGGNELAVIGLI